MKGTAFRLSVFALILLLPASALAQRDREFSDEAWSESFEKLPIVVGSNSMLRRASVEKARRQTVLVT